MLRIEVLTFRRVCFRRTWICTLALKVVRKSFRAFPDITVVHCLATALKEEQAIKGLEQQCARLMDGTKNCLAVIRQLAEEGANGPGRLTI